MQQDKGPIAVVGMACRFPGAPDLNSFWRLLDKGGNSVIEGIPGSGVGRIGEIFSDENVPSDACRFGAFIDDIDLFDPAFFRISPAEAELLDPQQRLMLETSWQALEDAGISPDRIRGSRTGVYTGVSNMEYRQSVLGTIAATDPVASLYAGTGTTLNGVSGRVAFVLGLEGPTMAVDAACASSLVSVHLAVEALERGNADLALAGGVHSILDPRLFEGRAIAGMLSPDGQCKGFDADANGFVRGEGCGIVVLKCLSDAIADGDRIWCVIRGSAVNHGGASAGFTLPNAPAQEQVIRDALRIAGIAPADVDFLEAHGTGTEAGDPIEMEAAAAVYGAGRDPDRPLLVGSVKSNIGHLEAASGIAGLIKATLALRKGVIPPHLHFRTPNPRLDWRRLPVRITTETTEWPRFEDKPMLAGVSAYGMSGTNAHVVIQGYEEPPTGIGNSTRWPSGASQEIKVSLPQPFDNVPLLPQLRTQRTVRFLPISGKTEPALREQFSRVLNWLETPEYNAAELDDLAWTLSVGRSHFVHRAAVMFHDTASLRGHLRALQESDDLAQPAEQTTLKVVFAYTGQGSQWPGMGRELYESEPVARAVLDRCEAVFVAETGHSLLDVMFGCSDGDENLDESAWAQPANYALQCALTAMWSTVGVRPDAVIGHSLGELAAAQAAGVFTLEDGMRFATVRGIMLGNTGAGSMAAIFASRERVTTVVAQMNAADANVVLSLAADNGTHQVVSGAPVDVEAISRRFDAEEIRVRPLSTTRGFHSPLLDPALDDLEAFTEAMNVSPPAVNFISNVANGLVGANERLSSAYWRRHAREPVEFAAGVQLLADLGVDLVVEIGPHSVLSQMVAMSWPASEPEHGAEQAPPAIVSMLRPREGEMEPASGFIEAVAAAYMAGLDIDFAGLYAGEQRRRLEAPGYAFQRRRFWFDGPSVRRDQGSHPLLGSRHESPHGDVMFQSEVSFSYPSWMADHRVFGHVVAPAALYGAMSVTAVMAEGSQSVVLEDFQMHKPLILSGGGSVDAKEQENRLIQVLLQNPEDDRTRKVEVFSQGNDRVWTLHATATANAKVEASAFDAPLVPDAIKARLSASDPSDYYRARAGSGVHLGPAFQGLRAAWAGMGEALGEISLPEVVDRQGLAVHPLLLDGCFQLLAIARGVVKLGEAATYMPFGWDRLWLTGVLPEYITCHARVRHEIRDPWQSTVAEAGDDPELVTADLRFYSADGAPLGGVDGFTVKRATRAAMLSAVRSIDHLLYEVDWRDSSSRETRQPADFLENPSTIAQRTPGFFHFLLQAGQGRKERSDLVEGMELLSQAFALSALECLGWERNTGVIAPDSLRQRLGVLPRYGRLFARLLELMCDAGILKAGEQGFTVLVGKELPLPDESLADPNLVSERLLNQFPSAVTQISMLARCGERLPDVLLGLDDPVDVLFSGEFSVAEFYRTAPGSQAGRDMLADAVAMAVERLPAERRLRILEIGAGTGSATSRVLPKLPAGQFDYVFTDISAGFLTGAAERFGGQVAASNFRTLDIEQSPSAQGFDLRSYDLIIADSVLHASRDLGETLSHCLDLLTPSGQLLALERPEGEAWLDMVFGLVDGWWRFNDAYRVNHALAGPPVWRKALADAGFTETAFVGIQDSDETPSFMVVAAQASAIPVDPPGLWVLASDSSAATEELAHLLRGRNQTVVVAHPESESAQSKPAAEGIYRKFLDVKERQNWRALLAELPQGLPLQGIVHLQALSGHGVFATMDEMMKDFNHSLGGALALVQGMLDCDLEPALGTWFITRGAQVLQAEAIGEISGAAVWGLGKVVARETPAFQARMIDLDPDSPELPPVLIDELMYPDDETLIAYRGGNRLIPRLIRLDTSSAHGEESSELENGLRPDRSYLITGGLGGIGGVVAGWLADLGAKTIVLNGRRSPDASAEATIDTLRQRGVTVQVELADVGDLAAVNAMLARIATSLPPLAGIVHSVGMLADAALGNQTWERFEQLLSPKALGAWQLHRATENLDLDLFILMSSMSGMRGTPGQANYASANAFLDQLAAHRRALGLPGQVIQWGAWLGLGEAEEQRARIGDSLAAAGSEWLTPQQGIQALDWLVRQDRTATGVTSVDWRVFAESLSVRLPFFDELADDDIPDFTGAPSSEEGLMTRLRAAAERERTELLAEFLQGHLQSVMRLPAPPARTARFYDLGLDSLMAVELRTRVNRAFAGEYSLPNTAVFDNPDVASLARYLESELESLLTMQSEENGGAISTERPAQFPKHRETKDDDIAIVGMACRFPGADDLATFWSLLESGGIAVRDGRPGDGPWTRLVGDPDADRAIYRRGGFIDGIDRFDPGFFQLTPIEARDMDPQQRLLLETSWHALDDAGLAPDQIRGTRAGVYIGMGTPEYRDLMAAHGHGAGYLGTSNSVAVGRVAFQLGLEGPAVPFDLACASSLAALHHAAAALRQAETDLALVGGVNAALSPDLTKAMSDFGMLSLQGQCRPFDAKADGFVRGEGCGVIVLKRLKQAEADGDRIRAVILGSAVNQNGGGTSLAAPSGAAQHRVIADALRQAGVDAGDMDYLETHGVGSALGDPIELEAAAAVFGRSRSVDRPLLAGSLKPNIGHLETASGIASVIKVALAMLHEVIPQQLHFDDPTPRLDWNRLPLKIVSENTAWPRRRLSPPLAGVSAFGISGANAHVVMAGYTPPEDASAKYQSPLRRTRLLPLSGKSGDVLRNLTRQYAAHLDQQDQEWTWESLSDLAWTAAIGRNHLDCRRAIVFSDVESLRRSLDACSGPQGRVRPSDVRRVVFSYSGLGSGWQDAARQMYEEEPTARAVFDRCEAVYLQVNQTSLLGPVFEKNDQISNKGWQSAAIYATHCALTALWTSVGVEPEVIVGHGAGLLAAGQAAGAFSLEDGLRLAASVERPAADAHIMAVAKPLIDGATGYAVDEYQALDGAFWTRRAHQSGAPVALVAQPGVNIVVRIDLDAGPDGSSPDPSSAFGDGETLLVQGTFSECVRQLYEAGMSIDFSGLYAGEARRRVSAPAYPFQRSRHWFIARQTVA